MKSRRHYLLTAPDICKLSCVQECVKVTKNVGFKCSLMVKTDHLTQNLKTNILINQTSISLQDYT
jgi:hypothetical protein